MAVWQEYHQDDLISGSVFDAASATQTNPLGKCVRIGPRQFVYAQAGGTITVATCVAAPAPQALITDSLAAAGVGATELTLTIAAATLDQFAGGYIYMYNDTGEGYTYRIASNTARSGGTTTITLKDPLLVAVDTTTDCTITPNPYYQVVEGAVAADIVGVAVRAATSDQFLWLQTKGPAVVEANSTITRGLNIQNGANGQAVVAADDTAQIIGVGLTADVGANEFQPVWLDIPTYS